jgi:hypothetical protein
MSRNTRGMIKITREREALPHLPNGLVQITLRRRDYSVAHVTAYTWIMTAIMQCLLAMGVAPIEDTPCRGMLPRAGKVAGDHEVWPCGVVGLQR